MEQHPVFKQPGNLQIGVWRCMDLAKFVRLLQTSTLHFARADRLGDPFEGSNTRAAAAWRDRLLLPGADAEMARAFPNMTREDVETSFRETGEFRRSQVTHMYVSCWHASFSESAAMWSLYAGRGNAIAIRTTYAQLASSLVGRIFMGIVQYVDWDGYAFDQGNMLAPIVHKQASYAHEQEVQAVINKLMWDAEMPSLEFLPGGVEVPVDLTTVIENVYVSPAAPKWFEDVVADLCA